MAGKLLETIDLPPASGKSFVVKQDEILRIIDIEGQQVGDFVCFNLNNLSDKTSSCRNLFQLVSPTCSGNQNRDKPRNSHL